MFSGQWSGHQGRKLNQRKGSTSLAPVLDAVEIRDPESGILIQYLDSEAAEPLLDALAVQQWRRGQSGRTTRAAQKDDPEDNRAHGSSPTAHAIGKDSPGAG